MRARSDGGITTGPLGIGPPNAEILGNAGFTLRRCSRGSRAGIIWIATSFVLGDVTGIPIESRFLRLFRFNGVLLLVSGWLRGDVMKSRAARRRAMYSSIAAMMSAMAILNFSRWERTLLRSGHANVRLS